MQRRRLRDVGSLLPVKRGVRAFEEGDLRSALEGMSAAWLNPAVVGKGWHTTLLVAVLHKPVGRLLEIGPVQLVEMPVVVVAEAQDDVVQLLVCLFDLAVEGKQQLAAGLGGWMGCHALRGVPPSK